eukprot:3141798-Pyramimonas_sp.AAC.1
MEGKLGPSGWVGVVWWVVTPALPLPPVRKGSLSKGGSGGAVRAQGLLDLDVHGLLDRALHL